MNREEEDFEAAIEKMKLAPENFVERAAILALARIKLGEKRIASLHFAAGSQRGRSNAGHDQAFENQFSKMHASLYYDLNQAYSNMFMFTVISNNKNLEKKAAKMANERYLREGVAIMGYLDIESNSSGGYSTLTESDFRADITEQLLKKGLDPVALVVPCSKCHAYKGQSCRDKKYKKIPSHKPRQLAALKSALNGQE